MLSSLSLAGAAFSLATGIPLLIEVSGKCQPMWQGQIQDHNQVLRAHSWVSSLAPGIGDRNALSSAVG